MEQGNGVRRSGSGFLALSAGGGNGVGLNAVCCLGVCFINTASARPGRETGAAGVIIGQVAEYGSPCGTDAARPRLPRRDRREADAAEAVLRRAAGVSALR